MDTNIELLIELDKLEKLMPLHADSLIMLSKTIRNRIWPVSDVSQLADFIYRCNIMLRLAIQTYGEDYQFVLMYVNLLDKHSNRYSCYQVSQYYKCIQLIIDVQILIKEHWKQLNPYFNKKYTREDLFEKSILDILEDFYGNIVNLCPEPFLKPLHNERFQHLMRGRRGKWRAENELMPPSIDIAKKSQIVNRWNPPDKQYLYLVAGTGSVDDADVVAEEMRLKKGETATISSFSVHSAHSADRILMLDYDDTSRNHIFNVAHRKNYAIIENEFEKALLNGNNPGIFRAKSLSLIDEKASGLSCELAGRLFLKELCAAIFIPLDESEDNDAEKKDKCYKSFHAMATFLERKGIVGIAYSSTRMKLIGKHGTCLVLFNPNSAKPIADSFAEVLR